MSVQNSGVLRAARSVANGEGDWAEVDAAVRDAIVLAVTQSSTAPLRKLRNPAAGALMTTTTTHSGRSPLRLSSAAVPSALTEGSVQSSIHTFDDAAWVRDEAVRSYAEFHNTIESLHAAMRTQLHPVWKTSMQLRPGMLAEVRDHFKLKRSDDIPDGVPITTAAAQHMAQQAMILEEVEDTLQLLRNTSVRFAAHYLSDEEKLAMGANPAYLRAPDIDREVVESHTQRRSKTPQEEEEGEEIAVQHLYPGHSRVNVASASGLISSKANRRSRRTGDGVAAPTAAAAAPSHPEASRRRHHHHHGEGRSETRRSSSGQAAGALTSDPLLEELKQQYQQRVSELEAHRASSTSLERPGAWPQVGSVMSSRTSRSGSSQSRQERHSRR